MPPAGPVRRLALPAAAQRNYLEAIGTAPSADELALEFDDVRPHLTGLDPEAVVLVDRIDALLDSMSGPSPLWHVDALERSPQWASLRVLAVELLRLMPFDGHPRPLPGSERADLLRVEGWRLPAIEYARTTGETPPRLPPADQVTARPR